MEEISTKRSMSIVSIRRTHVC